MGDRTNEIFDFLFAIFAFYFGFPRWNPPIGRVPDARSKIENKKPQIENQKSHFVPSSIPPSSTLYLSSIFHLPASIL
jgi:hypothetical protein